jgi:hypothetical protein
MDPKRRALLQFLSLAVLTSGPVARLAAQQSAGPRLPDRTTFESGDLLWPKKPGAIVPYHHGLDATGQEQRWLKERAEAGERQRRGRAHLSARDLDELQGLSFQDFYDRYVGDKRPGAAAASASGDIVHVGHVGIVDIDEARNQWVVEAVGGDRGVARISYDDWIKVRPGEIVWHGRVRDIDAAKRAAIAVEARKHVGKPYDFWNFDLNDDSGFYCSKLVWLCIWRSLALAIDGDVNPRRSFWFSPKQLLYLPKIARLLDHGGYATR